jgi:membrane protein DedA with SNARE-associated domain
MGRLMPGVTSFISIQAGIKRVPVCGWFCARYGSRHPTVNCSVYRRGWALGSQWTLVERYAAIVHSAVVVALAGGILWYLRRRWKARKS